jgi:transcriptional regulator with XRE-family HTH domain
MEREDFVNRLVELRMKKGVSAREMSLSIGQSAGYINNIECGINYPAMQTFFYICEYLHITPQQFFDTDTRYPAKIDELVEAAKHLNEEQLENVIAITKGLGQK